MEYGKKLADALEVDGLTGDPMLDLAIAQIPRMDLVEHELQHNWETKDGKKELIVPLYAQMDWANKDLEEFADNKTHNEKYPWNPKKARESRQLTFYSAIIWLMTGKLPKRMAIHAIPTKMLPGGIIEATGEVYTVWTERNNLEVLKMLSDMKKAWIRIQQLKKEFYKNHE